MPIVVPASIVIAPIEFTSKIPQLISVSFTPLVNVNVDAVSIVTAALALISNAAQLISVSAAPDPRVSCPTLVMPIVDAESIVTAPVALTSKAAQLISVSPVLVVVIVVAELIAVVFIPEPKVLSVAVFNVTPVIVVPTLRRVANVVLLIVAHD